MNQLVEEKHEQLIHMKVSNCSAMLMGDLCQLAKDMAQNLLASDLFNELDPEVPILLILTSSPFNSKWMLIPNKELNPECF